MVLLDIKTSNINRYEWDGAETHYMTFHPLKPVVMIGEFSRIYLLDTQLDKLFRVDLNKEKGFFPFVAFNLTGNKIMIAMHKTRGFENNDIIILDMESEEKHEFETRFTDRTFFQFVELKDKERLILKTDRGKRANIRFLDVNSGLCVQEKEEECSFSWLFDKYFTSVEGGMSYLRDIGSDKRETNISGLLEQMKLIIRKKMKKNKKVTLHNICVNDNLTVASLWTGQNFYLCDSRENWQKIASSEPYETQFSPKGKFLTTISKSSQDERQICVQLYKKTISAQGLSELTC